MFTCFFILSTTADAKKKPEEKSRFEQLEMFNKVFHLIETQYYRDVDASKLIEGAMKGMMDTLDPHSTFLSAEYFSKMKSDTSGEFGGLGLEITQKDGVLYVITPIDDTPAFRAGIKPRDKIVEINHEPLIGLTMEQALKKMRGEPKSSIKLGIVRSGEKNVRYFDLKREIIKVKPVKYELLEQEYAYIRLTQFQKRSTESVVEALKDLTKKSKKGIKGIILDLRANPGGLLDQAVDISSLFLNEGIVVSTEAKDPSNKAIHYVKKAGYKNLETPMVVLVNGASASASEIVAGALQDHKRALILGSRTFGKGSVQTVLQIDEDNGLKLTIAQYMTPQNRKIQAIGIVPDIEIKEYSADILEESEKDDLYIREKDLKNHLTATIETAEEKKLREEQEKIDRQKRIAKIKNKDSKSKQKDKDDDEIFKAYKVSEDYQVLQSIKYLKTLDFFNQKK
jgi:carboxyl-terminal processing protease